VKLRELAGLLGWRPSPRVYGVEVRQFDLPTDGAIEYAQWLHPGETPKVVSQEVVDYLRTFIHPGDTVIDIGAHTGDSTIPLALAAGPLGRVLALVPLNFAAAAEAGPVTFEYSDAGFCNGGRHEGISRWRHGHAFPLTVRGEHLPSWLQANMPDVVDRVRYIKVDAEGYDLAVLRSMSGLIDRVRPLVRAEVYRHTSLPQREALLDFFAARNYEVCRIVDETNYQGERLTPSVLMRWRHFDLFAMPM
jgi:FkbM family methyltransferase